MSDHQVFKAMEEFGGSFVRALAAALRVADQVNRERIKTAFPEVWEKYALFALGEQLRREAQ